MTHKLVPLEPTDTLLPCPFCGAPAETGTFITESLFSHDQVEYLNVGCSDCDIFMSGEQQAEVRAAWNTRAAAPEPPADDAVRGLVGEEPILQREDDDCTICAIAMMTGVFYERVMEVARDASGGYRYGGTPGVMSPKSVLLDLGFAAQRVGLEGEQQRRLRQMLWGRRAILSVPSLNGFAGHHDVYWTGRRVIDPSHKAKYAENLPDKIIWATLIDETDAALAAARAHPQVSQPIREGDSTSSRDHAQASSVKPRLEGGDQGLADALEVMKSTVRHLKGALGAWNDRGVASEAPLAYDMMCLGRDVTALEEIGRRLEAGEIARSKIRMEPLPGPPRDELPEGDKSREDHKDPTQDAVRELVEAREALADIAAERKRQIEVEGWTPEHDDQHDNSEMSDAAACYAKRAPFGIEGPRNHLPGPPGWWPWEASWWKPAGHRRMLVKAAALIVAEIERIDRAAGRQP